MPKFKVPPKVLKKISLEKEAIIRKISISKYPLMIINIIIYVIILVYLFQLNSKLCRCSSSWKKEFIKYFCFYAILRSILAFTFFDEIKNNLITSSKLILLVVLDFALFLSFLIVTLTYISKLKKEKCFCSKDWKREFMWILSWFLVALLAVSYSWIIIIAPIIIFKLVKAN